MSNLAGATITSATVQLRDLMCENTTMPLYCYPYTGTNWADGTVWSDLTQSWGSLLSSKNISYSVGASLSPSHQYSFNITAAVQGWIDGTYSKNKGIIFKSSSTIESGTSANFRTFGSYNRASYKPSLTITYTIDDSDHDAGFDNAVQLTLGSSVAVNIGSANERKYYKFTPVATGQYIIQSSNNTSNPKVWMYNSDYSNIGSNDDSGSNLNFRMTITLSAGKTYYILAGHAGTQTGTFKLTVLRSASLENRFYKLQNKASSKYLDVHGPGEQKYVHQWTTSTGEQQKWLIQKQSDGYYSIRSQYGKNRFVGVENANVGQNNVQLYDTESEKTKWILHVASDGKYILEPKSALGKALYAPDSATGTEMQLAWLGTGGDNIRWSPSTSDYNGRTFSAFDVGNSDEDEVALFESYLEGNGCTDIGTYNNADGPISAQLIKDVGRYSDIVYINGHGGRKAYLWIQDPRVAVSNNIVE